MPEADQMLTIYLPQDAPDRATIRAALAELSQAHGLGRGPGALLVALATGQVEIIPANEAQESNPPASLVDLLEHCAAMLQTTYPSHAEELKRRAKLLGEAGLG